MQVNKLPVLSVPAVLAALVEHLPPVRAQLPDGSALSDLGPVDYDRPYQYRRCLRYNCLYPFADRVSGVLCSLC